MATFPVDDVIRIDGVSKYFGRGHRRVMALSTLSTRIRRGEVTGLVGPDGSGKTTLMRLMAGLLKPDQGDINVLGQSTVGDFDTVRGQIGYMPQRFGLYEDLTVGENFELFGALHRIGKAELLARQADLMHFTGLAPFDKRLAGNLSGGMKQKLGLACALLPRPKVLLLDEPSVGVDPISRRELWQLVKDLAGEEASVVWSTAYLDEAEKCDRVIILDKGRVIADDTPSKIVQAVNTRAFLLPMDGESRRRRQQDLLTNRLILDATLQGNQMRIVVGNETDIKHIAAEPEPDRGRLEDAVVTMLRSAGRSIAASSPSSSGGSERVPGQNDELITVKDLSRRFGSFTAVDNVRFGVRRGEVFGLLGPNGAGKSTIFRILCGLLAPSSGTATVGGIDLGIAPADVRQRIGYMAQRFSLYGDLSVRENLRFIGGAYGLSGRKLIERLDWACAAFGLGDSLDTVSNTLSLGYKQRLSLAAAALHEPDILFLDEPTSGVDPLARREFWLQIGAFIETGMTVLVTSHFMDEAENCDRLAIIDQGRILALDSPGVLRAAAVSLEIPRPSLDDAFIHIVEKSRKAIAS